MSEYFFKGSASISVLTFLSLIQTISSLQGVGPQQFIEELFYLNVLGDIDRHISEFILDCGVSVCLFN